MCRLPVAGPHARRLVIGTQSARGVGHARRDGPRVFVLGPRTRGVRATDLRRAVLRTLERAAPHVAGDISVLIVDDAAMRRLNRRYRAKDAPTDVLAFPLSDGARAREPFGDIVVSYETARRQAREYGAGLENELARLLIHGTLHLCGYDHHERKAAARMHGLTRRMLRGLKPHA